MKTYSQSRLMDFGRCQRSYMFRHVWKITPKAKSIHLAYGGAMHKALFILTKAKNEMDDFSIKPMKYVEVAMDVFNQEWKDEGESKTKTSAAMLKVLGLYADKLVADQGVHDMPEMEFHVVIKHNGVEWMFHGFIDERYAQHGMVYVHDFKSCSQLGKTFFEQFDLNWQTRGYVYAASELWERCDGFAVTAFCFRLEGGKGKGCEVTRHMQRVTQKDMDVFVGEGTRTVLEIERKLGEMTDEMDVRPWLMQPFHCQAYGGCPYKSLCLTNCDAGVIKSEFRSAELREVNPEFVRSTASSAPLVEKEEAGNVEAEHAKG